MIVSLFSGIDGWGEALSDLGHTSVGIELDPLAAATARAAGHTVMRADLASYPPEAAKGATGVIASPPCQDFSRAGKQVGRTGERGQLIDVVPRWVDIIRPEWVCCEQVPPCLEIWEEHAHQYRQWGYSVWCGILNAANFGVPQTRQRAILMASRTRLVQPPEPTHAKHPQPGLFGTLEPWVTMAEALGWTADGSTKVGFPRKDDLGNSSDGYRERDWRGADEPAFNLTEKARSWTVNTGRDWKPGGTREDAQIIDASTEPAPSFTAKSGQQWLLNPGVTATQPNRRRYAAETEPAPVVAFGHDAANWCWERPATTVSGDSRQWPPGHKVNAYDRGRLGVEEANAYYGDRAGTNAIRLTVTDALILQDFPADYPVQGKRTNQFLQIGNAICPGLARPILAALL